jgi:hypothetical protein
MIWFKSVELLQNPLTVSRWKEIFQHKRSTYGYCER